MGRSCAGVLCLVFCCAAIFAQDKPADGDSLVEIASITIKGSRLPSASIVALSQLKVGQTINEKILRTACARLNLTGLFKNVGYGYEAFPDSRAVAVELTIEDEVPLFRATISVPKLDEKLIWDCLQQDALFTPELPATQAAMHLYETRIAMCVKSQGRDETIRGEVTGDKAGNPSGIVFQPIKLMEAKPSPKR